MSTKGEPTVEETPATLSDVAFTWGIFKDKEGIPFFAVVPIVKGQPVLTRLLVLTTGLEEYMTLYNAIKKSI